MTTQKTEGDCQIVVSMIGPAGVRMPPPTEADAAFMKALSLVGNFYLQYGKKQYGDQWWEEKNPEISAAFGLHKFAARLYKVLLTRELPLPDQDKLLSNMKDAVIYGLFLLATADRIRRDAKD